ncbi:MAG: ArnT family glycosyltransferase, partial [Myxococcota bacterium]
MRSTIGRNYLRYGFWGTGFKPVKNTGLKDPDDKLLVHWHHPPLVHMLVGVSFYFFGEKESSTRLVPIFFSLVSFFLIFELVRKRYGWPSALASIAFFSLFPLQIEYGKMANYEPLVMAFSLLGIFFLQRYKTKSVNCRPGGKFDLVAMILSFTLAGFTDWPGFIIAGVAGIYLLIGKNRNFYAFGLLTLSMTLLLLFSFYWLNSNSEHDGLWGLAKYRAGMGSIKVSYKMLATRTWLRLRDYIGFLALLPGIIWFLAHLIRKKSVDPLVFIFTVSTLIYFTTFKAGAWIHVFFLYYILPAAAVLCGVGAVYCAKLIFRQTQKLDNLLQKFSSDKLNNFLNYFRIARLFPVLLVAFWLFFLVLQQSQIINKAKLISYGVRSSSPAGSALPFKGRLDVPILADFINSITTLKDLVIIHRASNSSPQLRYYLDRKTKRTYSSKIPLQGDIFLIPRRKLAKSQIRRLLNNYHVYQ